MAATTLVSSTDIFPPFIAIAKIRIMVLILKARLQSLDERFFIILYRHAIERQIVYAPNRRCSKLHHFGLSGFIPDPGNSRPKIGRLQR
jgi:hypothetical protein